MTSVFLHPGKSNALNGRSDWTPGILTLVLSQVQELITDFLPLGKTEQNFRKLSFGVFAHFLTKCHTSVITVSA